MVHPRIIGLYLAAGKSSRIGRNKLNLPLGSHYLGSLAFKAALESELNVTIAVTRQGDLLHWLAPFSKSKGWCSLECVDADKGQSASLKTGVQAAMESGADAVVVLLGDQPFVTHRMINRLVAEYQRDPEIPFVAYLHKGILKPPILIAKSLFPPLMELAGDQGARAIIHDWKDLGRCLENDDDGCFFDADTIEDYELIGEYFLKKTLQ